MELRINHPPSSESPVQQLANVLLAGVERIARRTNERMQVALASYAAVPRKELAPVSVTNIRNLLVMVRDAQMDQGVIEADYRASGEARASQGVRSDEMLHGWRIGLEVIREEAHFAAGALGMGHAVLLEFLEATLHWGDVGMVATASAHREAELEMARREQHNRANLVRGVLFDSLAPAATREQAAGYGLDPDGLYRAVRARFDGELTTRALEAQLGIADGAGRRRGLAALLDGDFVGFVLEPLPSSITATFGVGPPGLLHEMGNSFRLATRAFEGALATGATGLVSMLHLGVWPAVVSDRDVGDEVLSRIVEPVLGQGRIGSSLLETVKLYMENDQRIDVTADQMFLHVNTVRYRLRRFEELSGMNLRRVDDLVQVWWAVQRHRLDCAADPRS